MSICCVWQYGAVTQIESTSEPCCTPIRDGALGEPEAIEMAELLKALADPVRLRLVSLLTNSDTGELCACDLPQLVDRSQPTTSHHLSILTRAGIIEREQRGKWAWFRVRPDRLRQLGQAISIG